MDTMNVMTAIVAATWAGGCGLGWYVRGKVEADGRKSLAEAIATPLLQEVTPKEQPPARVEPDMSTLISLYAKGYSLLQVGKLTGYSTSFVRTRLQDYGVQMRGRGRPKRKSKK